MLAYIVLRVCIASLKDLRIGIMAICVELVIGSQGYLFAFPLHGFNVSLRLALFCGVFLVSIIHCVRERKVRLFNARFFPYLILVLLCIGYGIVHAILIHTPLRNVFFDANAWLFLGLALPFAQAIRSREDVLNLLKYVVWALMWLAFKTVLFVFIFSHPDVFDSIAPYLYRWLRDDRIAEIFRFSSGFARVFIQSQVMALFGFALLYTLYITSTKRPSRSVATILFLLLLTILLSYSRTFWLVASAVMGIATLALSYSRAHWRSRVRRILEVVGLCFASILCVIVLVKIPLPGSTGGTTGNILTERVSGTAEESAAVTRFQQFKPLFDADLKHPLFGSGFGATVTYVSADLRIVSQNAGGVYTTYAFEWAYLDLWYKIGIVGVLVITCGIIALSVKLYREYRATHDPLTLGLSLSLVLLLGVHVFTPYINHPLGLGWILIATMYAFTSLKKV